MTKLSAILATGRISNLPTVWCNVLVAFLLVQLTQTNSDLPITLLLASCLAASCLYVGGCFLGDAVDVEFDAEHKPTRPIPMGILSRSSIFSYASTLIGMGITLPTAYLKISTGSWSCSALLFSVLLTAAIVIYSLWHKRSPWIGLPFIGSCRFFLVLFGAYVASSALNNTAISMESAWIFASCIGIYTICFASVASSESSPNPITWRKGLMAIMLTLPVATIVVTYQSGVSITSPILVAVLVYLLWMITAFRKINTNKGQFVSMSLAGFCLLDATFAAQFGWQWLITCFVLFGLSLLLQKWAPAT